MKIYEAIIKVLNHNGTIPIMELYEEVNKILTSDFSINSGQIRAYLSHKREMLQIENGMVSIKPEKNPISMFIQKCESSGTINEVRVNFEKNTFTFFEWHLDRKKVKKRSLQWRPGSVKDLRLELLRLNVWDWKQDYQKEEGIILDGISWSVELVTKGKTYKSQGIEAFPGDWQKFCYAVERLIGLSL